MRFRRDSLSLLLAFAAACSPKAEAERPAENTNPPPAEATWEPNHQGTLQYQVPAEWVAERPRSNLRQAQYRVPDKDGTEAAAELILFHFGPDAGTLEQNLERARSQIAPDPSSGTPVEDTLESAGALRVVTLDAQGSYSDQLTGTVQPDSRMLWAHVTTPAGPYFFKLVGPRGTVSDWTSEFAEVLRSTRFAPR